MSRREFLPLKRFVDAHRPITYGIVQAGEDVEDGVPYIRPIDMDEHNGVRDPAALRKTAREIAAAYTRSTVRPGDLVVSIGPSYGKTMIVSSELDGANLTQGTARIAPGPDVEASFIRWALRSSTATEFWDAAVAGATFRALNLEPLSRTPVPAWTLREQRGISDFLDAATARINALVEKKRHMVGGTPVPNVGWPNRHERP
jgi:type I restriction enzyme S subunit